MKHFNFNEMWKKEECPIIDGIIFGDGTILETDFFYAEGPFEISRRITLDEFLAPEPDNITNLYHSFIKIEKGNSLIMAGEGSWGGDGYVASTNSKTGEIEWVITSDSMNPIVKLELRDNTIIATNNWGTEFHIEVDIENKSFIICYK